MEKTKAEWAEFKESMENLVPESLRAWFSGASHDEIKEHALKLTRKLGRRFYLQDWHEYAEEHKLPWRLTQWRRKHLFGSVTGLASFAASGSGMLQDESNMNLHIRGILSSARSKGYEAFVSDNKVWIERTCPWCREDFEQWYNDRSVSRCTRGCQSTYEGEV